MAGENTDEPLISVREAARRLGVHENTVRNWARDGILASTRLPGSRFHRFDPEDVERLRRERAGISSIAAERRTFGPELVDATQLGQWAGTRDAQAKLPELVRRLLASTPGISNISIRTGEGVAAEGWDGLAESAGVGYLPSGFLCFEMGVNKNVKAKADSDYDTRRNDPAGVDPKRSTFVFITPRRWSKKSAWSAERRSEKVFADVQVLDADDLEGWLQETPAVHQWISEQLGRRPRDAQTLELWWARFKSQTKPSLPASLFLAGREPEQERLAEFLGDSPGAITIAAGWRDEAIAFVCASIDAIEKQKKGSVPPALLLSSPDVWERVVEQPAGMTLLPLFEKPDLAAAFEHGHHVVLPVGQDVVIRDSDKMDLPRPHPQGAAQAFESVGLSSDTAYELASLARRSMPSLVRKLARDPRIARPPWAEHPHSSLLGPLMLLGSWTTNEDDIRLVSEMAEQDWPSIERTLEHWRLTDDPPFVRSRNVWHLASPEEAFLVLGRGLTVDDISRWKNIAISVLLETDPRLELSPEERATAGISGIARQYSSVLRRGISQSLVLLAVVDPGPFADGMRGSEHSRRFVQEVLSHATMDESGAEWQSLADELPLLAEAAPQSFLDAVHDDLDRKHPLLGRMFQDSDQGSALYSSSPHTGLLWALETLCWSADFLVDASRALARLHLVDPGGRLSNRPLESLQNILAGWVRNTAAPLGVRISAIEQTCRDYPTVGWRLLLSLWPSDHAMSTPPSSPKYRDWKPQRDRVLVREWVEFVREVVRLSKEMASNDLRRWAEIVEHLGALPEDLRDGVVDSLEAVIDSVSMTPEEQLVIWEQIHKEVSRHRQFASADWSMPEESLKRLESLAERLEPTEHVERFAYLFDWHPDLPGIDPFDHDAYDKKLAELRAKAVAQAIDSGAIDGLRALARRTPESSQLGWVVGEIAPDHLTAELLGWLDSENDAERGVARAWASRKLMTEGIEWLRSTLKQPEMISTSRRTTLILNAPAKREFWDALADIETELSDAYWEEMNPWGVQPPDAQRAARTLLEHNRPWAALDVVASALHHREQSGDIPAALVEEILDAVLTADTKEARVQSIGYEVGRLLDVLESSGSSLEKLAGYEFSFFQLLEHHREPRALKTALNAEPALFVDLVKRVYRGKDEPRRSLNEREAMLARQAWWVLHSWRELPGRREDGTIDSDHLSKWIQDVRLALADANRADIGDEQIGQILSASPVGEDGIWPAEPVREIIETVGSPSIESGLHIGVLNGRGVTTRGIYDGGRQERDLAARYRAWAVETAGRWRRTSRVLRGIAEDYEREARREDAEAQLRADIE